MSLTKTKSGNYAKQTRIGQSRTISGGTYLTQAEAEAVRKVLAVVPLPASAKVAARHCINIGTIVWLAKIKNPKKGKVVMIHATASECEAVGKTPGPLNHR
jgi:metal-dependent hydrolase (beta-lactamase superfamily II)